MTTVPSALRCSGCGYTAPPDDPYPFRCPNTGTDGADHVLVRVLDLAGTRFPAGTERNPFLRYRTLLHSYQVALAHGMSDAGFCDLVSELDAAVARVDGHGFEVTPFFQSGQPGGVQRAEPGRDQSAAPGRDQSAGPGGDKSAGPARDGLAGAWVKNETGNVSGSHKGRHLMGVLTHLTVMERIGLSDPAARPGLAIASCGNAALAAAVVARAGGWRLAVFVPPDADENVLERLRDLGSHVVSCPRQPGVAGDPAYLRLLAELAAGALPFTTQGNENGLAIEGGLTLGYELATALAELPGGLDHLVVQVGGGALASAVMQGLTEAGQLGVLHRLPRIHTVQTFGAHPLERAYHRVRASLLDAGQQDESRPVPVPGGTAPEGSELGGSRAGGDTPWAEAVRAAMAHASAHRADYMWPWESEPKSVATGILDDETYDWRAVVEGMLLTRGQPVVVSEELLVEANSLGVAATGIKVDPTGSSGLAGLLALRRSGAAAPGEQAAILFTGIQR
ncbi:MAG TPA: pyridoxal-phosphate dependent enzyme [Streptosporangiaceae bacterium]|jgi:threonine synthase